VAFRKLSALILAVALLVGAAGTALAQTVGEAVYGTERILEASEIERIFAEKGVKDVDISHWAASSIAVALQAGHITPDAEGNVRPDGPVPTQVGVAVFAKLLGIASPTDTPEVAAQKAAEAGFIAIEPGQPLTRMHVAEMIFKALGLKIDVSAPVPFADAYSLPRPQQLVLAALKKVGVFKGFPDGTFQPDGVLTMAQLATLVNRILGA